MILCSFVLSTALCIIAIIRIVVIIALIVVIVIVLIAVLSTCKSIPTEQEPVQSGSYPSYTNTDDTAAENNSAPSEEVNSEVDEYYHPTVQTPEANDEIPSVEVQDNENEQQPLDENTDINE